MKGFTKRASVLVVGLFVAGAAVAGTPVNERTFSMTLPDGFGQFAKQEQKNQKVTTYVAKSDKGGVVIVSHALMAPTEDLDAYLASERDSLVKSLKATLGAVRTIQVDGKDAVSFDYTIYAAQPMFGRADIVVADPRVYQVIYLTASPDGVTNPETSQMFSSFNFNETELEKVKAEAMAAAQPTIARNESEQ